MKRFIIVTLGGIIAMFNRMMPAHAWEQCSVADTAEPTVTWLECKIMCDSTISGKAVGINRTYVPKQGACVGQVQVFNIGATPVEMGKTYDNSIDESLTGSGIMSVRAQCPKWWDACSGYAASSGFYFGFNMTGQLNPSYPRSACANLVCEYHRDYFDGAFGGPSSGGDSGSTTTCAAGEKWYTVSADQAFYDACYGSSSTSGAGTGAGTGVAGGGSSSDLNINSAAWEGAGVIGMSQTMTTGATLVWSSGAAPTTSGCVACSKISKKDYRAYRCEAGYYSVMTNSLSGTTGWYATGFVDTTIPSTMCKECPSPAYTASPTSPVASTGEASCYVNGGKDTVGSFTFGGKCSATNTFVGGSMALPGYECASDDKLAASGASGCSNYADFASTCAGRVMAGTGWCGDVSYTDCTSFTCR